MPPLPKLSLALTALALAACAGFHDGPPDTVPMDAASAGTEAASDLTPGSYSLITRAALQREPGVGDLYSVSRHSQVQVSSTQGEFARVRMQNGDSGWLPVRKLKQVVSAPEPVRKTSSKPKRHHVRVAPEPEEASDAPDTMEPPPVKIDPPSPPKPKMKTELPDIDPPPAPQIEAKPPVIPSLKTPELPAELPPPVPQMRLDTDLPQQ